MANAVAETEALSTDPQVARRADLLVHIASSDAGEVQRAIKLLGGAVPGIGSSGLTAVLAYATSTGEATSAEGRRAANQLGPDQLDAEPLDRNQPGPLQRDLDRRDWIRLQPYPDSAQVSPLPGIPTSASYSIILKAALNLDAKVCLLLGPNLSSLSPQSVAALVAPVLAGDADLCLPVYALSPYEGMLNTAVLYPLTRALFGGGVRYPLGFDLAMSQRFQQRLLAVVDRRASPAGSFPWPATEALFSGMKVAQAVIEARQVPHVDGADLASILTLVLGSLFADAEAKAAFWQRVRQSQPTGSALGNTPHSEVRAPEVSGMIESFRLGAGNLQEIWGLVMPPNTLLAVRKLARIPAAEFRLADALWARIVYDFLLAYRLGVIGRSHLLGAFVPLYLGWVASYVLETAAPLSTPGRLEQRIEALAEAFESEKPYIVARWRWPDRFNP